MEESELRTPDSIGKFWVQMCQNLTMFAGNQIKMLMEQVDKSVQLNLLFLFMKIGIRLDLLME